MGMGRGEMRGRWEMSEEEGSGEEGRRSRWKKER